MLSDQRGPAGSFVRTDEADDALVQNLLFWGIGQTERLCHAEKNGRRERICSFLCAGWFRPAEPLPAITNHPWTPKGQRFGTTVKLR